MVYTTTTVFTKMWPVSECVACGAWCVSWLLTCSLTSSLSVKLFYRMSHINSCGCCWVHLIPAPLVCVCLSVGPGNVSRVLRYLEPPPANCSGVINLHNGPCPTPAPTCIHPIILLPTLLTLLSDTQCHTTVCLSHTTQAKLLLGTLFLAIPVRLSDCALTILTPWHGRTQPRGLQETDDTHTHQGGFC